MNPVRGTGSANPASPLEQATTMSKIVRECFDAIRSLDMRTTNPGAYCIEQLSGAKVEDPAKFIKECKSDCQDWQDFATALFPIT